MLLLQHDAQVPEEEDQKNLQKFIKATLLKQNQKYGQVMLDRILVYIPKRNHIQRKRRWRRRRKRRRRGRGRRRRRRRRR